MKKNLIIFIGMLLFLTVGCSSSDKKIEPIVPAPEMSDSEYTKLIESQTQNKKEYSGLHNKFDLSATLLTSALGAAELDRKRFFFQWDNEKTKKEREKYFQEKSSSTRFFISFFSPDKELRNLHRPQSLWKIYLEYNGKVYSGKIIKSTETFFLLKKIYPHHTKWGTPYFASFDVPTTVIEKSKSKLVLTSSAGKAIFKYEFN